MVALPDTKLSPYISIKDPPNDGPVDGEILENVGAEEISKSSDRDSSNVEGEYNETLTVPTAAPEIQHAARVGLLKVAGNVEIKNTSLFETLQK